MKLKLSFFFFFVQLVDASTLKREVAEGVDLMVVRELTGGMSSNLVETDLKFLVFLVPYWYSIFTVCDHVLWKQVFTLECQGALRLMKMVRKLGLIRRFMLLTRYSLLISLLSTTNRCNKAS